MRSYDFMTYQVIDINKLESVEIFTRLSPPCQFCNEVKKWVKENLPYAKIIEHDMRRDVDKWRELYKYHPEARVPPQVAINMRNGVRRHIGGYQELLQAFSQLTQEET